MRPHNSIGFDKKVYKLKKDKATFYIPSEVEGMPAPSVSTRPEEREFEVDLGATMHMMSQKEFEAQK